MNGNSHLAFTFLLIFVYISKGVQGAPGIDLTNYEPSKNSHLEAVLTFQNILTGNPVQPYTPWSIDKLRQVRPSYLAQLYNPDNPLHVQALKQFQTALRDGAPPSLIEQAQEHISTVSKTVSTALNPATYLGSLSGSGGIGGSLLSSLSTAGRAGLKTILSMIWSVIAGALATLFPPLAILTTLNPVEYLFPASAAFPAAPALPSYPSPTSAYPAAPTSTYPSTPNTPTYPYPSAPTAYPSAPTAYPSAPPSYPSAPTSYPSAPTTYPSSSPAYPSAPTQSYPSPPNTLTYPSTSTPSYPPSAPVHHSPSNTPTYPSPYSALPQPSAIPSNPLMPSNRVY